MMIHSIGFPTWIEFCFFLFFCFFFFLCSLFAHRYECVVVMFVYFFLFFPLPPFPGLNRGKQVQCLLMTSSHIPNITDHHIIIGGDFKQAQDPGLDRSSTKQANLSKAANMLVATFFGRLARCSYVAILFPSSPALKSLSALN